MKDLWHLRNSIIQRVITSNVSVRENWAVFHVRIKVCKKKIKKSKDFIDTISSQKRLQFKYIFFIFNLFNAEKNYHTNHQFGVIPTANLAQYPSALNFVQYKLIFITASWHFTRCYYFWDIQMHQISYYTQKKVSAQIIPTCNRNDP